MQVKQNIIRDAGHAEWLQTDVVEPMTEIMANTDSSIPVEAANRYVFHHYLLSYMDMMGAANQQAGRIDRFIRSVLAPDTEETARIGAANAD